MRKLILACALLISATGCAGLSTGEFQNPGEYRHKLYPVRVGYQEPSEPLLGDAWYADNFTPQYGKPKAQKTSASFMTTVHYDTNDDGTYDLKKQVPIHDLRLVHRRTGAAIWMVAQTISTRLQDRELRIFAREFVEELSGVRGAVRVAEGVGLGALESFQQSAAAIVTAESPCKVGSSEAYSIDFDVADSEQLKLDASSRTRRGRLLVVRTPYERKPRQTTSSPAYPVIVLVGYTSRSEDFASHLPDLERFMAQIGMGQSQDAEPPAQPNGFTCAAVQQVPEAGQLPGYGTSVPPDTLPPAIAPAPAIEPVQQ